MCTKCRLPNHWKEHLSINSGEKSYFCSLCKKSFSQASTLNIHYKKKKKNSTIRYQIRRKAYSIPSVCSVCKNNLPKNVHLQDIWKDILVDHSFPAVSVKKVESCGWLEATPINSYWWKNLFLAPNVTMLQGIRGAQGCYISVTLSFTNRVTQEHGWLEGMAI